MPDRVTNPGSCGVEPRYPVRSLVGPYDEHGWTLLSTGSDTEYVTVNGTDLEERVVRSQALHYLDVSWDPYSGHSAAGGSWRHTFALDSLAFVLRNGYASEETADPPGDSDWFVPDDDEGTQLQRSAVRIESGTNQPTIGVRRGQNLVGFVDGDEFANELWSNASRGREFARTIEQADWSEPDPTTEDLGQLATELERRAELEEANESLGSFVLGTALTLGVAALNPPAAGLVGLVQFMMSLSSDPQDPGQSELGPIAYDQGFEGVLDYAAPVQGHRVVFDVYAPRCTPTSFTVESWFGEEEWSAKWNVPLQEPGGWTDSCEEAGVPSVSPSDVPLGERFSTAAANESTAEGYGNERAGAQVSLLVESLDQVGRYALDVSGTVTPNDPVPDGYTYRVYDAPQDFDPSGVPDGQLDEPLYQTSGEGATHCVTFHEPGDYVIEAKLDDGGSETYRTITVDPTEFGGTHTITLESSADGKRHYHVAAEESLEQTDANGASINDHDEVDGTEVEGILWGGTDSYTFTGDLQRVCGDDLTVRIDGVAVDPSNYGPDHVLTIDSRDDTSRRYSLSAGSNLQRSTANDASINSGDAVSGNSAAGRVGGGTDSYTFDGELQFLQGDGIRFTLDGREIDPAFYGPEHTLRIESPDGNRQDYSVEVSGSLELESSPSAIVGPDDPTVRGSSASGAVESSYDEFAFTGEVVEVQGTVEAYVDGEKIYDGSELEHVLTIERPGPGGASYSLEVGGTLWKSDANGASKNPGDSISVEDGTHRASGYVGGGKDSYTFEGELLDLEGDVDAYLDGEQVRYAGLTEHVVTIDSPDGTHRTYSLEVQQNLQKSTANGASKNSGDTVTDGTRADGAVVGGRDSYTFEGELVSVQGDGVRVRLDGEVIREGFQPEPTVTIGGPTSVDTDTEVTYSAELEHFSGSPSFNWMEPLAEGDSYFDDAQSQSHTFGSEGTHELVVHASTDRGESATGRLEVTVDAEPTVDLSASDTSVTTDHTVTFDAWTSGFDSSPTLTWEGASGSGASASNSWGSEGTYTVTVTADAGDVTVRDSVDVSVRPQPDVSVDGPTSAQVGDDLTFGATVEHFRGSPSYNWQPPVGDGNSYFDDGATQSYTPTSAGSFEAQVAVSSDRSESASGTLTVDVTEPYESVSVDLSADDTSVRDGDQVTFDAAASGGEGSIDYAWSGASGSGSTATKTWNDGGNYTVEVTASDGQTSDSASVEVSVREPSVSISGPSNVDEGDSVTYSASVSDFLGNPDFNWQPPVGDGNSYFDDGSSQSHYVSSGSDYTASVAVTSDQGESASASMSVDVDADTSGGSSDDGGSSSDSGSSDGGSSDDGSSDSTTDDTPTTNEDAERDCVRNMNYSECEG